MTQIRLTNETAARLLARGPSLLQNKYLLVASLAVLPQILAILVQVFLVFVDVFLVLVAVFAILG